jgi:hypothetical protein
MWIVLLMIGEVVVEVANRHSRFAIRPNRQIAIAN